MKQKSFAVNMPEISVNPIPAMVLNSCNSESTFRQIAEILPTALYITDCEGRITFYNAEAAKMWGRAPTLSKDRWCGSHRLFWPDGSEMALDECPMAQTIRTGRAVRDVEAIAERPDGSRYWFALYPTPLFDEGGEMCGAVNMLVDITERKRIEESDRRLAAIVASSDDAIISKLLDGTITSWNEAAQRLFGYKPEEIIGQSVLTLIPPDRHNEEALIIDRLKKGERIDHFETVRRHKDGSLIDISLTVSPVKRADGTIIGASKIAREIGDRKRAEKIKEMLLHEIKHRVKNTLATIQAIASQTFRKAPAEERQAFVARLHALSGAHDLLTQEDGISADISDIVRRALKPFLNQSEDRVRMGGGQISLGHNKALLVAMVLHELCTNAVKYGAWSGRDGTVTVSWELDSSKSAKPALALTWQEHGGPPVSSPEQKGFGSRLIEGALGGDDGAVEFDFRPEGLTVRLSVSLEA